MEYYNKILCVTSPELTSGSNPIFKEGTLNVYASTGKISRVHRSEARVAILSTHGIPFLRNTESGIWNVTATLNNA